MRSYKALGFALSASMAFAAIAQASAPSLAAVAQPNISVSKIRVAPQVRRFSFFAGTACAKTSKLLYVSDALDNVVDIYTLGQSKRQNQRACGQIGGFSLPQGLAVDLKGNLYVADTSNSRIVKFAPGRTTPSQIIADPGEYPAGVTVNAHGLIAVTNVATVGPGTGSISVFRPNGTAVGTFQDPQAPREYFAKFDAAGDIFTTYSNADETFGFVNEFTVASGYKEVKEYPNVLLNGPGGIDIIGSTLYVGDASGVEGNLLDIPIIHAYKHGLGAGTSFGLSGATVAPTFEFGAANDGLPLYAASAGTAQAQEYLFGKSDDIASFLVVGNLSQPVGIAVTRGF